MGLDIQIGTDLPKSSEVLRGDDLQEIIDRLDPVAIYISGCTFGMDVCDILNEESQERIITTTSCVVCGELGNWGV